MTAFVEHLPALLRLFAEPTTPHTTSELWCRIGGNDWELYAPILLHELETGGNDVKRLVLSIVCEQASIIRDTSVKPFLAEVERLLADDDRLMRMAAIDAIRQLFHHSSRDTEVASPSVLEALRRIVCRDELPLAREALFTLLEVDKNAVTEIAALLRGRQK